MKRHTAFLCWLVLATLWGCDGGNSGSVSSPVPPPPPPPAGPGPGTGIPGIDSIRQEFLTAVNQARSADRAGHCRNIMNPDFEEIGAAYAEGAYLGNPAALYWTFDLASPD